MVHYLKSVPCSSFYGGLPWGAFFRPGGRTHGSQVTPYDYVGRGFIFNVGGAYILSADLIPFINIGTEYVDVIVPGCEDCMIGEILGMIGVKLYGKSKDYIVYINITPGKLGIIPPNSIFIHNLKSMPLLSEVYRNHSSTYTVPFYKDYHSC